MIREGSSTPKPFTPERCALQLMRMANRALTPDCRGEPLPILKSCVGSAVWGPSRFRFEGASAAYQMLVELLVRNIAGDQLPAFWYVEKGMTITATFFPRE